MHRLITAAIAMALAGFAGAAQGDEKSSQIASQDVQAPLVTILGSSQSILGREVRSKADENIGRIIDVVVDRTGRARAAVIDFGGFLGVGSRKIAVDWDVLNFAGDGEKRDYVVLELTRDQVKAAPEYKERRTITVLGSFGTSPPAQY